MGAWSHESFGNDAACDWAMGLQKGSDLAPVDAALDKVLASGYDYLKARQACEAIAAAEVVARLLGNFGLRDAYSEDIDDWVARFKLRPSSELILKADTALDRILATPSELMELWADSGESDDWRGAVNDLKKRIRK